MNNIITIYKISLPFLEASFVKRTKYSSIGEEMRQFLKYQEIFISEQTEKFEEFEQMTFLFTGGKIKLLFYYEQRSYLPDFQVDVFSENLLPASFFTDFYSIFTEMGREEYIFDIISEKINIADSRIVTDFLLAQNFKNFNFRELYDFLQNTDLFFLEERLSQNKELLQHLYYLLFINIKLFKNILLTHGGIGELESLLGEDIDDALLSHLTLSHEKISHVRNINITTFRSYQEMVQKLFSLFEKK